MITFNNEQEFKDAVMKVLEERLRVGVYVGGNKFVENVVVTLSDDFNNTFTSDHDILSGYYD